MSLSFSDLVHCDREGHFLHAFVLGAGAKARPYDPARLRRSGGRSGGRAKSVTTCPARRETT